jgi:hypothetical protein
MGGAEEAKKEVVNLEISGGNLDREGGCFVGRERER